MAGTRQILLDTSQWQPLTNYSTKLFRLINSPALTNTLQSLSTRRDVASLSLFYRYYHGHCSSEIFQCTPNPLRRAHSTCHATHSHPKYVQLCSQPRIEKYEQSFFYSIGKLWNSLPRSVFPSSYNLNLFKTRVSRHLDSITP